MSGKKALLSSVLVLLVVLSFGALASAEPVKIRFVSLAWQEQSIAANYEIVDEWNRLNPCR